MSKQYSFLVIVFTIAALLAIEVGATSAPSKHSLSYLECIKALRNSEVSK